MKTTTKRRIIEVVLSALVVMNVMAVAGCGDEDKPATVTPTPKVEVTQVPTTAPTATVAPTATPKPTATPTVKPTTTTAPSVTKAPTAGTTTTPADDTTPQTGDNDVFVFLGIATVASAALFFAISKTRRA